MISSVFRSLDFGLLEVLLPRICVLCGTPLLGIGRRGGPFEPLCPACAAGIVPFAGPRCPACGKPLISEKGICMRCRGRERSFDEAVPIFAYEGNLRALLGAYKFRDRRSLVLFFAALVGVELSARWPGRSLVPVPPRPGKVRARGWDQVEYLGRELERRGFSVTRALERLPSKQQKRLGRAARRENAAVAYRVRSGSAVPKDVVLLDDVITTGATAEACARALKDAGASAVAVLVLAAD